MKLLSILPLVATAAAFVIPDAETARSLQLQPEEGHSFWDNIKNPETIWEELEDRFKQVGETAREGLDNAAEWLEETTESAYDNAKEFSEGLRENFAGEEWLQSAHDDVDFFEEDTAHPPPHHGPHHPPPHHGPPHHGPPHHGPPHHGPHHGPHKHNLTIYQLISKSNFTTKLVKLVNEFPDLVKLLNSTEAHGTFFAPLNSAFEKIPKGAPKPSKEFLAKLLAYHASPEFYPAGRILVTRTIPSALGAEYIGEKFPQRLSTQIGLRGLTINFYARVKVANVFGTNGVIHGIDSILVPPPKAVDIISALPGVFSTLELGLYRTGLFAAFNDTSSHQGGTLFAPSNFAFRLLGPRINAFLFSTYGEKYLKALILYHVSGQATLYSDAIYKAGEDDEKSTNAGAHHSCHRIPKGLYHVDLETGLKGKSLSIDIARYGRLITIKVNGFTRVTGGDGVAADGVIHLISNVLIPPKNPGDATVLTEDMSIEELKERLAPFVDASDELDPEL